MIERVVQQVERFVAVCGVAQLGRIEHRATAIHHVVEEVIQLQALLLNIRVGKLDDTGAVAFIDRTVLRKVAAYIWQIGQLLANSLRSRLVSTAHLA